MNQTELELNYSRHNYRHLLRQAMHSSLEADQEIQNVYMACWFAVNDYLRGQYSYQSKVDRVAVLKDEATLDELVVEVMGSVLCWPEYPVTLQQVAGYMSAVLPFEDPFQRVITAGELLGSCARSGLFELIEPEKGSRRPYYVQPLVRLETGWINDLGVTPPMVEPPKVVTDNSSCGYHTFYEPTILGGREKYHEGYTCPDVLNLLNQIQWSIDESVLLETEVPKNPLDTEEKKRNWDIWLRATEFVEKLMLDLGNRFYFPWAWDCRGRAYSKGWQLHIQSTEYRKAVLNFAHAEHLTEEKRDD